MCEQHGTARLTVGTLTADGSGVLRTWVVSACWAELLADGLGEPHIETFASQQSLAEVQQAVEGVPGVIRTERKV